VTTRPRAARPGSPRPRLRAAGDRRPSRSSPDRRPGWEGRARRSPRRLPDRRGCEHADLAAGQAVADRFTQRMTAGRYRSDAVTPQRAVTAVIALAPNAARRNGSDPPMPAPPPGRCPQLSVQYAYSRIPTHGSNRRVSSSTLQRRPPVRGAFRRVPRGRGPVRDRADIAAAQVSIPLPFTPVPFRCSRWSSSWAARRSARGSG
jgi:hypothetical protein